MNRLLRSIKPNTIYNTQLYDESNLTLYITHNSMMNQRHVAEHNKWKQYTYCFVSCLLVECSNEGTPLNDSFLWYRSPTAHIT